MAVEVTEEWIRERVQLKHNNLEDVRSLALPGTYHEKIGVLGNGLRYFSRLKALDLSRNAIESLAGLENLQMLEKLNLYYNNIGSLQELYRLRQLPNLQDLDLRLNPVARNEPDYRLFVIHMLTNLRRLDDRAVRDGERKAALMHFSSDQAAELTPHPAAPQKPPQQPNPRVQHVQSLAKPMSALDADDVTVLELMSTRPAGSVTGSTGSQHNFTEHPPYSYSMPQDQLGTHGNTQPSTSSAAPYHSNNAHGIVTTAPFVSTATGGQSADCLDPTDSAYTQPAHTATTDNVQNKREDLPPTAIDPNLQYADEISAYTSYKAKGYFTPHPGSADNGTAVTTTAPADQASQNVQQVPPVESDYLTSVSLPVTSAGWDQPPPSHTVANSMARMTVEGGQGRYAQLEQHTDVSPVSTPNFADAPVSAPPPAPSTTQAVEEGASLDPPVKDFLQQVSLLADKYWNGAQSLMKNDRFKSRMLEMLRLWSPDSTIHIPVPSSSQSDGAVDVLELMQLRQQVSALEKENTQLREAALTTPGVHDGQDADPGKLKSALIRAQRDVSILRDRLQKSQDENRSLQEQLGQSNRQGSQSQPLPTLHAGEIEQHNEQLRQEIAALNIRLKQSMHMQELAGMLQESHKSLVQTNEHLLKELEELRQRYHHEVRTLRWSYDQLKKPAVAPPAGVAVNQYPGYAPHPTPAV